ncbi:MAG TPA: hypothetical protein VD860_15825 [Azospirillum sp.]|nr:hypothetical protein [Azospirillum sp.]
MPATYIADLPAAASLADGDAFPLDTGSATLKATLAQIRAALPTAELAAALAPLFAEGAIADTAVDLPAFGTAAYLDAAQIPPTVIVSTITEDSALTGSDAGKLLVCTAPATITLPGSADDGLEPGWVVWIKNRSGGAVSVQCAGADQLDGAGAPLALADGTARMLVFDGLTGFESV